MHFFLFGISGTFTKLLFFLRESLFWWTYLLCLVVYFQGTWKYACHYYLHITICKNSTLILCFSSSWFFGVEKSYWMAINRKRRRNYWDYNFKPLVKVIHTKYSKHRPSTLALIFECLCSKINHVLNHWLFILLLKLINCPIHWIVYK